jgi:hypothetical protein
MISRKIFSIVLISALSLATQNLFSQALFKDHIDDSIKKEENSRLDGSSSKFSTSEESGLKDSIVTLIRPMMYFDLLNLRTLNREITKDRLPYSEIFKYYTTADSAYHRCYEIVAPLPKSYSFHFNFMSLENFTLGGSR